MAKCICCKTELGTNTVCGYCGWTEVEVFDEEALAAEKKECAAYRSQKAAGLRNFRLSAYTYEYKDNNIAEGRTEITLGDGAACDGKILWSEQEFVQSKEEPNLNLVLQYNVGGAVKQANVTIPVPVTDTFWRLGLRLRDDLHLDVLVGTKEKHTVAERIPLQLA